MEKNSNNDIREIYEILSEIRERLSKIETDVNHLKKIIYAVLSGLITLLFSLLSNILGVHP